MAKIDRSIFKAYDIRGKYPEEINEETAYLIGRAFVSFLKCREVVVGRDARTSSPAIYSALVKGITEQGADVVDIGLATTPLFYFAIANYSHESGIMITASHNPKQYNGLKLCRKKAVPIGGDTGIMDIKKIAEEGRFPEPEKKGAVRKKSPVEDYAEKALSFADIGAMKPLKVVVDAGNGMVPVVFPKITEKLPIKAVELYFEVDCSFPNHEANPSKEESTAELRKRVVEEKADFGVAFDGDADRVAFVDEKGNQVPSDLMTALIARHLLEKNRGEKVLYEVRSSWAVRDEIKKSRGKPVLWKAGHALIKEKMRKENIFFGGEKSGHYFYREFWYADSAIITFIHVLNILSKSGKKLSELIEPVKIYFDSGEINFEVKEKDKAINKVEGTFKKEAKNIMHIDGLTMEFEDWWFNLRKSNTEPLIRLNLEAKTTKKMEEMREKLKKVIGGYGSISK